MNSFNDLLFLHDELDEMFLEHQRALVRGELDLALEKLAIYQRCLVDHILDEEEHLLPIYGERVQAPVGATVQIFLFEHKKIRDYLPLFKAEFAKLYAAADRERAIIFLLDSQTTFKKLLVHHDAREKRFLYPLLDGATTATERLNLFSRLRLRPREATVSA